MCSEPGHRMQSGEKSDRLSRLCLKCPPMNPETWETLSKQGGSGRQLQDLEGGQNSRQRKGMVGAQSP